MHNKVFVLFRHFNGVSITHAGEIRKFCTECGFVKIECCFAGSGKVEVRIQLSHNCSVFGGYYLAAALSVAISSFFIFIISCITPGFCTRSFISEGVICQLTPNLSLSHPHMLSKPPSDVSLDQEASISSCMSHSTTSDIPSDSSKL